MDIIINISQKAYFYHIYSSYNVLVVCTKQQTSKFLIVIEISQLNFLG